MPLIGYSYWDPKQVRRIEVPDGEGVAIYLSDEEISCHDYPFEPQDRFPPLPIETGAIITLYLPDNNTLEYVNATFDIESFQASTGAGTDRVSAEATVVDTGDGKNVRGWLEYDSKLHYPDSPKIEVDGAFDVPFCS